MWLESLRDLFSSAEITTPSMIDTSPELVEVACMHRGVVGLLEWTYCSTHYVPDREIVRFFWRSNDAPLDHVVDGE